MTRGVANIFGASPVQPLEQHIDIACRCAKKLRTFFPAVIAGDWGAAAEVRDKIDELEEQADELKKQIRLNLPKSLFMPVPREDLLELLLVQDGIANRTRDVARIVMGRRMQIPGPLATDFLEFVKRIVDAAKKARKSVRELDELFTVGFRGAEVDLVSGLIEELDAIETETGDRQMALTAALYEIESTLNPVDAVFLYNVIDLIWKIAESADRVGRRLELLLSH